jgi:protein-disulfide isomerase
MNMRVRAGRRRLTAWPGIAAALLVGLHGVVAGQTGVVHVKGDPAAPLHLVEYADFACTACGQFARETLPRLERDYIETGRLRMSFVPFNLSFFKPGRLAARAAECAAGQGAFWPMHDLLYERQREWLGRGSQRERYLSWARELELDAGEFEACYDAAAVEARIDENSAAAADRGVRATPTFFLGERRLEGALGFEILRELLEAASPGAAR